MGDREDRRHVTCLQQCDMRNSHTTCAGGIKQPSEAVMPSRKTYLDSELERPLNDEWVALPSQVKASCGPE